jgi:hypothetical protein
MPFSANELNNFKNNFVGGTRQNRFRVLGTFPSTSSQETTSTTTSTTSTNLSEFHIRSTLIPTLQTSTVAYDFFGRKLNYPGEKLYSTWSVTVLDDTNANNLWTRFHNWQNNINNHVLNETKYVQNHSGYKTKWTVQHLDLNGNILKTFILAGLWPRTVNEISFSHSRTNALNTFNVVFVYDTIEIPGITPTT